MTAKTAQITLGGDSYLVHAFTIGELERVTDAFALAQNKVPFAVLRIALERAEPKIEDPSAIEATTDEVTTAVKQILALAGLGQGEPNPPGAAPAA